MARKTSLFAAIAGLSCALLTGCVRDAMTAKTPVFDGPCTENRGESTAAWERFRAAHPLHIQGVAVSDPFGEGCRTLVIAEPPPDVTLENLVALAPELLTHHQTKTHGIGFDGWTKDVVITLPKVEPAELDELVGELHEHMFGTTYKSYTLDIRAESKKTRTKSKNLDLRVTHEELRQWISAEEKYRAIEGGDDITLDALLHEAQPGVYLSNTPGLVVWALPRHEQLDESAVEARQFVLDSDLVIGAVASDDTVLILGRERLAPLDVLPPLRVETLQLLASVDATELAQSYERRHVLAGRVGQWDWAPIYLSDELYDTEFGSMLDITDQLLKSWSNNGETRYMNFDQPDPRRWGFDKALFREFHDRGVDSLVYNWNTSGFGASLELGSQELLAFRSTAALPVTYLPETKALSDVGDFELRGYEFFASQSDPNLVRVAQYTALYQTFQAFGIHAAAKPRSSSRDAQVAVLEREVLETLKRYRAEPAKEVNWKRVAELDEETRAFVLRAVKARHALHEHLLELDGNDLGSLAKALAVSDYGVEIVQLITVLGGRGELDLDAFVRRADLVNAYGRATKPRKGTWIHTPSGVLSRNTGEGGEHMTGGHNIDAKIFKFSVADAASDVGSGKMRVDLGRIDRIRLNPNADPTAPARTVAVALERPANASGLVRGAARSQNTGWTTEVTENAKIPSTPRSRETLIVVSKDGDGYRIVSSDRHVLRASTAADARDVVLRIQRRARGQSKSARIVIDEFPSPDEARGFSHALRLRSKADDVVISSGRGSAEQWASHRFDFRETVVKEVSSGKAVPELHFDVATTSGVTKSMRFTAWTAKAKTISAHVFAKVKALFDKVLRRAALGDGRSTIDDIAKEMRKELDAHRSELGDVEFEIVNEIGDALIVRLDPQSQKKANDG